MCGIAGMVGNPDRSRVEKMVSAIHRRGPDDKGIYLDNYACIGMARLAIIDLSLSGHQPMQSDCGRYWIVYNGECYNFQDIKEKLGKAGVSFKSHSDTEVVLAAYVHYGPECLQHFNGMFAFAIWDSENQELFAARDRFGIKPFYYTQANGSFLFGSEIKTLLSSGVVDFQINGEAVFQYFSFGHIIQPLTIIEEIRALMPGHYLLCKDGNVKISKYWELSSEIFTGSYNDAKELLRAQLSRSVKMQLISDRPLGLFLSGGLDSASVLSAMTSGGAAANTFSIGFEENPFAKNEGKDALELAERFGSKHTQIMINGNAIVKELENYFVSIDQPTIDGLNTFFVSKYAVQEMTVALSGLGGDELFGGYARIGRAYWKNKNLNVLHESLNFLSKSTLSFVSDFPNLFDFFLRASAYTEKRDPVFNYTASRLLSLPGKTLQLLRKETLESINIYSTVKNSFSGYDVIADADFTKKVSQIEMQGFMSAMILRDMDPISMFHSLEVRFPLIDHDLVNLAFSFPTEFKLSPQSNTKPGNEGSTSYRKSGAKRVLLETMEPLLPKGFGDKPKNGFKIPLNYWLRNDMKSIAMDIIREKNQPGFEFVSYDQAQKIARQFFNSQSNNFSFWSIISFLGSIRALKQVSSGS